MMEDIPDHPLDLNKLVTLPPSEWTVSPCGDGMVMIGAWTYPHRREIIQRPFRFTVYETDE